MPMGFSISDLWKGNVSHAVRVKTDAYRDALRGSETKESSTISCDTLPAQDITSHKVSPK